MTPLPQLALIACVAAALALFAAVFVTPFMLSSTISQREEKSE